MGNKMDGESSNSGEDVGNQGNPANGFSDASNNARFALPMPERNQSAPLENVALNTAPINPIQSFQQEFEIGGGDQLTARLGQVENMGGGFSYNLTDIEQVQRYMLLGTTDNSYYTHAVVMELDNILCLNRLLDAQPPRHEEVIQLVEEFSLAGRAAKEESILKVLAVCATHSNLVIRKAAYRVVPKVCNIPTKLFKFLEISQEKIDLDREKNPPKPQLRVGKRTRKRAAKQLGELNIGGKVPQESDDLSSVPPKKMKKMEKRKETYKKVNTVSKKTSGWGRLRRKGIGKFYTDEEKDPCRLLYLLTKYNRRHTWSHKQLLGCVHPKLTGEYAAPKNLVLKYITRGFKKVESDINALIRQPGIDVNVSQVIEYIKVIHQVRQLSPRSEGHLQTLLTILKEYGIRQQREEFLTLGFGCQTSVQNEEGKRTALQIVREHIPTEFLKSKEVWKALLQDMPMTAMIRNLGKMSNLDLFSDPDNVKLVVEALGNKTRLGIARVHPMAILIAMQIYQKGGGHRGALTWTANGEILKALDHAFYLSFKTPEVKEMYATGKRYMLCLDVSQSMHSAGCVGCSFLTPAMASIAMAMVQWNLEEHVELMYFGYSLQSMTNSLRKDMTINEVMQITQRMRFGATDCALPIVHAFDNNMDVDVFIVYTDSETNVNRVHPCEALERYNKRRNKQAKLVVVGMQSNMFTIARPGDRNSLNVVGFDANVPLVISEFVKGN